MRPDSLIPHTSNYDIVSGMVWFNCDCMLRFKIPLNFLSDYCGVSCFSTKEHNVGQRFTSKYRQYCGMQYDELTKRTSPEVWPDTFQDKSEIPVDQQLAQMCNAVINDRPDLGDHCEFFLLSVQFQMFCLSSASTCYFRLQTSQCRIVLIHARQEGTKRGVLQRGN